MRIGRLQINLQIYPLKSAIPERWSWSIRWWKKQEPVKATDLRNPPQKDTAPSKNERRIRSIGAWP